MSEWTVKDSIPVDSTSEELFRLADPLVCLVCGAGSKPPYHLCEECMDTSESWGDRFTWRPAQHFLNRVAAERAPWLGVSVDFALKNYILPSAPDGLVDYADVAMDFFKALGEWLVERPEVDPNGECFDRNKVPERFEARKLDCTYCRFKVMLYHLSLEEDKRHGVKLGSTLIEWRRLGRERTSAARAAEIADLDVTTIVEEAMRSAE